MRRAGERGYALVAAVASILVFAGLALSIQLGMRATSVTAGAEIGRARASAAADAGMALALHHLLATDAADRWSLGGGDRRLRFGDATLLIRLQDERGKVPLGRIDEAMAQRLLEKTGLSGEALRIARDSLLDWTDEDDEQRADGAEAPFYAPRGIAPPNAPPRSIGELARIRGFDPAVVARVRPLVTTAPNTGSFDPRYADPDAIEVMQGDEGAVAAIERRRELAGARPAIELGERESLIGRPLTIAVIATTSDGARVQRRALIELTGAALRPYTVLAYD